jgi:hypothetical protein
MDALGNNAVRTGQTSEWLDSMHRGEDSRLYDRENWQTSLRLPGADLTDLHALQ